MTTIQDTAHPVAEAGRASRPGSLRGIAVGPAAAVVATMLGLWIGTGVSVGHALLFLAYELGFVLLPGWVVWRALAGARPGGPLRQLVLGWALGYAIELAFFTLTGAAHARGLLPLYPLVALAAAVPRAWRQRGTAPVEATTWRPSRLWQWSVAGLCIVALVYLAAGLYSQKPLPGHWKTVAYDVDTVYALSLSAEAKHHWPIRNPTVSNTPLPYYVFAFMNNASASQVTGLPLSEEVFRLTPAVLFVLAILGLALAGRELAPPGLRWAGPLAVAFAFFVGEIDPFTNKAYVFGNSLFLDYYLSPTFLLGACFFLPALLMATELVTGVARGRARWLALALLAFGCTGSKVMSTIVLGAGLGAVALWALATRRRETAVRAIAVGGVLLAVFAGFYLLIFSSRRTGFTIEAFKTLQMSEGVTWMKPHLPHSIYLPLAAIVGTIGFAGPTLAGIAGLGRRRGLPITAAQVLMLGSLAAGMAVLYLMFNIDGSHLYFVWYGVLAGALLAGQGLAALIRGGWRPVYTRIVAVPVAALVAVGLLDAPLDLFPTLVQRVRAHQTLYSVDDPLNRGMTSQMLAGFEWIKSHTKPSEVLAVNNHYRDDAGQDSRYFYFSAFSERRVLLESWLYTSRTDQLGYLKVVNGLQPFPDRLALNRAVFDRADPAAMSTLRRRYGVTTLVVDKRHGPDAPALARFAPLLFGNRDIAVYANRRR